MEDKKERPKRILFKKHLEFIKEYRGHLTKEQIMNTLEITESSYQMYIGVLDKDNLKS
jgi:hypothetical protein